MVKAQVIWADRHKSGINPTGADPGICRENEVNAMADDALATCVARTSAAMVLTMKDSRVFVFFEEWFPIPAHLGIEKW